MRAHTRVAESAESSRAIAVGYLRRSTDRQEQSIGDQRRAVESFADEQGLTVDRFYTDDAISGTRASNRPAFQQMVADAEHGAFGSVIVYDVKRFGRLDNDEAGYYRHVLRTRGVEVLYVTEGFNGSETDDLLRPVKQWQARQESKDLSKVTIRGQLTKAERGDWLGGTPPHGYDLRYTSDRDEFLFILRFMPDGSKQVLDESGRLVRTRERGESVAVSKRDRARLVPGETSRVEAVRNIFRLYVEQGLGFSALADRLNGAGVPTPRGPGWSHIYSGKWRDSTVRSILVNPLYAGDSVWNRRTDGRFHKIAGGRAVERREIHGARLVPNDESNWIIVRDTHESIVSRRLWEAARRTRESRPTSIAQSGVGKRPVGGWSGARARFLLSGLVTCGRCGGKYQGVTRTKGKPRKDGTRVKTRYYGCGNYIARGKSGCEHLGPIPQEELEQTVIERALGFYRELYSGPQGDERLSEAVRDHLGVEAADLAAARYRLHSERQRIEHSIANLLDNISESTRDLIEERLMALRADRTRITIRSDELDRLAASETEVAEMVYEIKSFLAGLEFTLSHGANEEKRSALRRCVGQVRIDAAGPTVRLLPLCLGGREGVNGPYQGECTPRQTLAAQ